MVSEPAQESVPVELYGRILSPTCYLTHLVLGELRFSPRCVYYEPEAMPSQMYRITPYGVMPVLVSGEVTLVGIEAVLGWFFDQPSFKDIQRLLPESPSPRAEVRYLCQLYHQRFAQDVSTPLFHEKIASLFTRRTPDATVITAARRNLHRSYLPFLEHRSRHHAYLAGQDLSLADLTVAVYLCCLDYQGEIPWADFTHLAAWYQRMKSRKSFSPLLEVNLPRRPPSKHFATLDGDD